MALVDGVPQMTRRISTSVLVWSKNGVNFAQALVHSRMIAGYLVPGAPLVGEVGEPVACCGFGDGRVNRS